MGALLRADVHQSADQAAGARRALSTLGPGGWLFGGHSENLHDIMPLDSIPQIIAGSCRAG
ncbi:MAG TPA: hypothetical protein VLX90_12955 [Steroidobacteraceae bacterium]|nr:hypothetical protein [Steroidobacteraceae bacterium]